MKVVIALAILLLGLISCQAPPALVLPTPTPTRLPCSIQAQDFLEEADRILAAWSDAVELAQSTPRIALPSQISRLQELRRQALDPEVPECAAAVQERMGEFMEYTVKAFIAFMEQEQRNWTDTYVAEWFDAAKESQDLFMDQIRELPYE